MQATTIRRVEPYDVRAGVSQDRPEPVLVLPKSVPIPANNHKTITKWAPDANSATYQEPPKATSVLASTARQSSSRSAFSTAAIARTVTGTR